MTRPGPKKGVRLLPSDVEQRIEQAIDDIFKTRERPTMAKLRRDVRRDCDGGGTEAAVAQSDPGARIGALAPGDGARKGRGRGGAAALCSGSPRPASAVPLGDCADRPYQGGHPTGGRWGARRPGAAVADPAFDVFSRSVLGFGLSFDAPSAAGVAVAVAQGVLPKAEWLVRNDLTLAWPMHGTPHSLHLDNGAEFHSRALKRGCQQHGVRIDYRPPATPRFGGHIERLMGTLMTRVHALPGTTSSNPMARGDYPSEQKAILTLREFERILALEILGPYHNEVHAALGTTPTAAWAAGVAAQRDQAAGGSGRFRAGFPAVRRSRHPARRRALVQCHLFRGALAPLLDSSERRYRIKYDPRNMSAVFVELPPAGICDCHAPTSAGRRSRYGSSGPPPGGCARRGVNVDEAAIFAAIEEQRRVLAEAQSTSKAARRAAARLPNHGRPRSISDPWRRTNEGGDCVARRR